MKVEVISSIGYNPDKTLNILKLTGKSVLTESGKILGKVREVRLNQRLSLEGIVLRRNFPLFFRKMYISKEYFQTLSEKALILDIEPHLLHIGKKVINTQGKILGKVKEVIRQNESNNIDSLIVKKFLRKNFIVKHKDIKSWGKSIIIKD